MNYIKKYIQNKINKNTGLKAGFSMIEMMFVIGIMAMLMAVAIPALRGRSENARKTTTEASLRAVQQAIDIYHSDTGMYPEQLQDLVAPANESIAKLGDWPYIESKGKNKGVPQDGWKKDFYYALTPRAEQPYELFSYGNDKGEDGPESKRISAW